MRPRKSLSEEGIATLHEVVMRIARELEDAVPQSDSRPTSATAQQRGHRRHRHRAVPARTVNEQLIELGAHGILKQAIAQKVGFDPSYLSQLLRRGMNAKMLLKIAKAAGVPPQHFEEYVAKAAPEKLMHDLEMLEVLRAYFFEADEFTKCRLIERSRQILRDELDVDYLERLRNSPGTSRE
ncbi:MAG TPA: helix-turn-helix transcriptional regulator [Candidatus Rubrimentiphilum sp.]|nr:helix-turn-helix transcriptional regulator [Candidatus Rubrimentiphilum sp.]